MQKISYFVGGSLVLLCKPVTLGGLGVEESTWEINAWFLRQKRAPGESWVRTRVPAKKVPRIASARNSCIVEPVCRRRSRQNRYTPPASGKLESKAGRDSKNGSVKQGPEGLYHSVEVYVVFPNWKPSLPTRKTEGELYLT